jgi:hypothetical protein
MTLQKLFAHLRFKLDQHGWLAAAGLALVVCALGFELFGVAGQRLRAAELRTEVATLRLQTAQRPNQDDEVGKRLATIYASLPAANGALEAVNLIHRAAAANNVNLANGEYRLLREGGAQLQRYQITLPARSTYPQLRAWLADVMTTVPAAMLDEITIRRDDVGNGSVESRVRLTLFLKVT